MSHNRRMLDLSLNKLKLIAKSRAIKDYEKKILKRFKKNTQ